jgi:hypothetical protein
VPTRTLGDRQIDQQRHDKQPKNRRQRQQSEAVRTTGDDKTDQRHQRERTGQHHLVDRAGSAAVLGRHELCRDREWRRNGKTDGEASQQADDDQMHATLRQRNQQGEEVDRGDTEQHDGAAAPVVGDSRRREPADASRQARCDGSIPSASLLRASAPELAKCIA